VSEPDSEIKQRNRQIAENESDRQTVGAVRISLWAIAIAALIGLTVFGWMVLRR
jgi:hypothetical protein